MTQTELKDKLTAAIDRKTEFLDGINSNFKSPLIQEMITAANSERLGYQTVLDALNGMPYLLTCAVSGRIDK